MKRLDGSSLRMYLLLVKASVRSRMQHPFNFVVGTIMAAFVNVIDFALIAVVLRRFGQVQDWSMAEVAYLYGVIVLCKALYRTFASDVHQLEKYLVSGDLDQLLTRPVPVLLALMSQNVTLYTAEPLLGVTMVAWSLQQLMAAGQVGWAAVPLTLLMVVTGAVILFAIGLATATAGFWITRIRELQVVTEDASKFAAQYPLSLYPKWLQYVLCTLIPVGFANYIPSLYVLRGEPGFWVMGATALVAGLCLMLSLRFWRFGLSRYQSAGS
ncbi:ABC transporter permease [Paenibacillus chartarius]|uniref:ABC transporter permease n=1 Tax=Paenibacillus chartarius TaxID=747481 RepID=A0ABV6DG66_9BACL